jgi:Uma2 family endonuclease
LPENKLELIDGFSECRMPFATRSEAEAHFEAWAQTLARWQGVEVPPMPQKTGSTWRVEINGFRLSLCARRVELEVPMGNVETFSEPRRPFWWRDFWDGQPKGLERGWEFQQRHNDVRTNFWSWFREVKRQRGGIMSSGVDVVLSKTDIVQPDVIYYSADRRHCLVDNTFFEGAPDLIGEVLSPASRLWDYDTRRARYAAAGVPHLWLADPELKTLEVFELGREGYRCVACLSRDEVYEPPLFAGMPLKLSEIFDSHWEEFWGERGKPETAPSGWIVPPSRRLGLQHLLLIGHTERRYEIWDNRAPCVLAFGSEREAMRRFRDFVVEICHWEGQRKDSLRKADGGLRLGRFDLRLDGRRMWLNVDADARLYRRMLDVYHRPDVWQEDGAEWREI